MPCPAKIQIIRSRCFMLFITAALLIECSEDEQVVPVIKAGTIWTWGSNQSGGLGDGTQDEKRAPVQIENGSVWKEVSPGSYSTYAIREDGTLWAWGDNSYGQLGDGTTIPKYSPVQIGAGTNWDHISAGSLHVIAIKNDGTLWSWGRNANGQLGLGIAGSFESSPKQVGSETKWSLVSAGDNYSVALKTDRSLWAWGGNENSQLGDETFTNRTAPVRIGSSKHWKMIASGFSNTFAIRTDGTLWGWGNNITGQLGVGVFENFILERPYQLNDEKSWVKISNGFRHVLAIKADGSLWAWGNNSSGQLGTGNKSAYALPVRIGTDNDWADVSAGQSHSIAISKDGTVWAWGQNQFGQVASSEIIEQLTPYMIPGDGKWILVRTGSGSSFSAGLKE